MKHKPNPEKHFIPSWLEEVILPTPGYIDAAEDMAHDDTGEDPPGISAEDFDKLVLTELPDWLEGDLRARIAKAAGLIDPQAKQPEVSQPPAQVSLQAKELVQCVANELQRGALVKASRPNYRQALLGWAQSANLQAYA